MRGMDSIIPTLSLSRDQYSHYFDDSPLDFPEQNFILRL